MLTNNQLAAIAVKERVDSQRNHKYLVILDNSKNNDGTAENATIICKTNNYEDAVETANFWDERMNTHFVTMDEHTIALGEKVIAVAKLQSKAVEQMRKNDFTIVDEDVQEWFDSLPAFTRLELYAEAAYKRI